MNGWTIAVATRSTERFYALPETYLQIKGCGMEKEKIWFVVESSPGNLLFGFFYDEGEGDGWAVRKAMDYCRREDFRLVLLAKKPKGRIEIRQLYPETTTEESNKCLVGLLNRLD